MNDNAVHQEQCGRRNRFKGRSDLRCLQDIQAEIQLKSSFESKLKIIFFCNGRRHTTGSVYYGLERSIKGRKNLGLKKLQYE